MSRLPVIGAGDREAWGAILNDFLLQHTNADGTLKASAVIAALGRNPVAVIAPSNATSTEKARADFVCDAVDDHAEIIQAQTDRGANGGKIELMPGDFLGLPPVSKNKVWIAGAGMHATTYKIKNGSNANAWTNYVSADGVEANAEFITISDLCIDCNAANQTAGNGIFFNNNPTGSKATNDIDFDPHNLVANVLILNAWQDSFQSLGRSETRLINVYSERAGRYSFNPSYDTFLDLCTAAHPGLAGFFCQSSSIRGTNCKAFYCGQVTPGSGRGLWIRNTHSVVFDGFTAQDNQDSGVLFDGAIGCEVTGNCDSNSTRGVGSAPAVDLFGAVGNLARITCVERKTDGAHSYQQNAIRLRSGSAANDMTLTHQAIAPATIGAALKADSDPTATGANRIYVNGAAV